MSKMDEYKSGDVVQIDPCHDKAFGGAFMVVTEVRDWGLIGYFPIPEKPGPPGQAYYRVSWGNFEKIGLSVWLLEMAAQA